MHTHSQPNTPPFKTGTLYLIPTLLGDSPLERVLPAHNADVISELRYFIVENVRTARRFLKKVNRAMDMDALTFVELNRHTRAEEIAELLTPLLHGRDAGVISEAGCPAIADPGADVVALAQQKNIRVVPLVGASAMVMALMASGFNGQCFAFQGYLPVAQPERIKALRKLENRVYADNQTQLFIETPYRNMSLLADILAHCQPATKLCIAADITLETEFIQTKTVKAWKTQKPELNKRPCVFLMYK